MLTGQPTRVAIGAARSRSFSGLRLSFSVKSALQSYTLHFVL
jgi:hypothetical protein